MNIRQAVECAELNARVLMLYETEKERARALEDLTELTFYDHFVNRDGYRFSWKAGGSVTLSLGASEVWRGLEFQEGNDLARERFPECFLDEVS